MSSGDQLPISRIGKPDYNVTLEAGRRVVGPKTRCGEILAELIRHRETRSVQLDKQKTFRFGVYLQLSDMYLPRSKMPT